MRGWHDFRGFDRKGVDNIYIISRIKSHGGRLQWESHGWSAVYLQLWFPKWRTKIKAKSQARTFLKPNPGGGWHVLRRLDLI